VLIQLFILTNSISADRFQLVDGKGDYPIADNQPLQVKLKIVE
jgi:hypothetical protein